MNKIKKILDIAKDMSANHDIDTCFLIVGSEGSGKSHLLLNCLDYLGESAGQIALDKKDFISLLSVIQDARAIGFDEAGDGLLSRDFASDLNKQLVKTFMIIRAKRLIVFLVLPSFFMLDSYFRRHRVKGLFYVYRRGKVAFYDKNGIEQILIKGEKLQKITGARPLFFDSYPRYTGPMLQIYNEQKRNKVNQTLMDLKIQEVKERLKK